MVSADLLVPPGGQKAQKLFQHEWTTTTESYQFDRNAFSGLTKSMKKLKRFQWQWVWRPHNTPSYAGAVHDVQRCDGLSNEVTEAGWNARSAQ